MEDPRVALQPYLTGTEVLRWTGRPPAGLMLSAQDIYLIPFGLLWTGIVLFSFFAGAWADTSTFTFFFSIPFVLVGAYILVGRFLVDMWARSQTVYGLTDRRALILRLGLGGRLVAVDLASTPQVGLSHRADGSGTVEFGKAPTLWDRSARGSMGWGVWSPGLDDHPRFLHIPDVLAVYQRIEASRAAGRAVST